MARALGMALVGFGGLAVQACGGATDVPRLEDDRVLATPPPSCDVGATYTDTLSITKFDPDGFAIQCGNPPDVVCSFYPNNDMAHQPNGTIDEDLIDPGYDCQKLILNGALVDSGVVETTRWAAEATERCGEPSSALHFTAANLSMCYGKDGRRGWGASYEIDFGPQDMKGPIDASGWDGFSFWVKRGAGSTQGSLIVLAVDRFATGAPLEDPRTGEEVSCTSTAPEISLEELPNSLSGPDFGKCDPFAAGVTLTDEWTFVPVYFSEMKQKGFGTPAPLGLSIDELMRLQFIVAAGDWDLWIDDVNFFRAP